MRMHSLSAALCRGAGWLMLIAGPSIILASNSAPAEGLVSVTAEGMKLGKPETVEEVSRTRPAVVVEWEIAFGEGAVAGRAQ